MFFDDHSRIFLHIYVTQESQDRDEASVVVVEKNKIILPYRMVPD